MKPEIKATWFIFSLLLAFVCLSSSPLTPSGVAKRIDTLPCPALFMMCPTYVVSGRSPITFSLDVAGTKRRGLKDDEIVLVYKEMETRLKLSFKWEVTGGKIVNGQETRTLLVEPTGTPAGDITNVSATVEVNGGPPECDRSRSCILKVDPDCNAPEKFSGYGDLRFESEKEQLDNLVTYLLGSGQDSVAYIVAYGGKDSCFWEEGRLRAERAKNYLVEKYRIDNDRIIAVDGGYRENLAVELFLSTRRGCGPFPSPTVRLSDVEFHGYCDEKYKRHNEAIKP